MNRVGGRRMAAGGGRRRSRDANGTAGRPEVGGVTSYDRAEGGGQIRQERWRRRGCNRLGIGF